MEKQDSNQIFGFWSLALDHVGQLVSVQCRLMRAGLEMHAGAAAVHARMQAVNPAKLVTDLDQKGVERLAEREQATEETASASRSAPFDDAASLYV